jgi:hypothetical protein
LPLQPSKLRRAGSVSALS